MNRLRREQVVLAVLAPLVIAAGIQLLLAAFLLRECAVMMRKRISGDNIQTNAAYPRWCPCEILVDDILL
ncbi:hypothetical protein D3C78_1491000 [compost metagenome]